MPKKFVFYYYEISADGWDRNRERFKHYRSLTYLTVKPKPLSVLVLSASLNTHTV